MAVHFPSCFYETLFRCCVTCSLCECLEEPMNLIKTDPQLLNFWEMSSFSVFLSFVFVIFWTPGHHVKQQ